MSYEHSVFKNAANLSPDLVRDTAQTQGRELKFWLSVTIVVFVLLGSQVAVAQTEAKTRQYVIREGDTCVRVARRELGNRRHYRLIHKHNDLGRSPHKLKAGTKLTLPILRVDSDAVLSSKQGPVRVLPTNSSWNTAKKGMALYRSWRVNSRDRGTAELTFRDTSQLMMRENTVVIIYGQSASRTGAKLGSRATLESGSLRARLSELSGGKLTVETPSSEAVLSGGMTLVTVDPAGTSRIANHKGAGVRVRGRKRKRKRRSPAVELAPGYGSKVVKDTPPSPPKQLPPTPTWKSGRIIGIGIKGLGAEIQGSWEKVEVAESYRVEIASNQAMTDVVASAQVPKQITNFVARGLPAGMYYLSVASIDDDAFESAPSEAKKGRAYELTPKGQEGSSTSAAKSSSPNFGKDASATVPKVVVGSTLEAPPGVVCSWENGEKTQSFAIANVGAVAIDCTDADGSISLLQVQAVPGKAVAKSSLRVISEIGGVKAVPRSVASLIELEIGGSPQSLRGSFEMSADSNLVIVSVLEQDGNRLTALVTPRGGAPEEVRLMLRSRGSKASSPPVASTVISILTETEASTPASPVRRRRIRGSIGLFGIGSLNSVGTDSIGVGGGIRLSALLQGWFVETEFFGSGLSNDGQRNKLLSLRAQVGIEFWEVGGVTPFVLLGAGARHLSDTGSEISAIGPVGHYGLGAQLKTGTPWSLRCGVRHVLAREPKNRGAIEAHAGLQHVF